MSRFLLKKDATNPFAFMRRVTDELDRAFGMGTEIGARDFGLRDFYPKVWTPEIEILERDNKFIVRADLPGLTKENVKIEVTHDQLTIEGERKLEKEEQKEGLYRSERAYGSFLRVVPIPEHVRAEDAVATFKNGVLQVEMPTIPVPEPKKRTVDITG
jgi:HSP20 family protein